MCAAGEDEEGEEEEEEEEAVIVVEELEGQMMLECIVTKIGTRQEPTITEEMNAVVAVELQTMLIVELRLPAPQD